MCIRLYKHKYCHLIYFIFIFYFVQFIVGLLINNTERTLFCDNLISCMSISAVDLLWQYKGSVLWSSTVVASMLWFMGRMVPWWYNNINRLYHSSMNLYILAIHCRAMVLLTTCPKSIVVPLLVMYWFTKGSARISAHFFFMVS